MRGLVAIAVGIAAIVVIAVAAAAIAGNRGPAEFDEGTPEAAIQVYLVAVESGDTETSYAMFSESVQADLSIEDYERAMDNWEAYGSTAQRTVYFDHTEISGDSAQVYLTVEESYPDGGFVAPPYSYSVQVRMVNESGEWLIDEPLTGLDPYFDPGI